MSTEPRLVEAHLIELRERLSALEALTAVDRLILAGTELEPVVDALLDRMTRAMRCEQTCIAFPSEVAPGRWDLPEVQVAQEALQRLRRQLGG